jgi:penicillin amidase
VSNSTSATTGSSARGPGRLRRLILRIVLGAVFALAILAVVVWRAASASLPSLDGTRRLPGLSTSVTIERDALGIPSISGRGRDDLARATGFVHAQERYFQMDLARRFAAGELAAILGRQALPIDRTLRLHRLRAVAVEALRRASPGEQQALEAYTAGVNEGLDALGAVPPEYLLLRSDPAPWRPEDSLLAIAYMYVGLQHGYGRNDEHMENIRSEVAAAVAEAVAALTPAVVKVGVVHPGIDGLVSDGRDPQIWNDAVTAIACPSTASSSTGDPASTSRWSPANRCRC